MCHGVGTRLRRKTNWVLVLLSIAMLVALAGCGGGGGGGGDPTFTLSGTIAAPSGIAIDSDVNDPNEFYASNDTIAEAQEIANPVSLGGYVNVAEAGFNGRSYDEGDEVDFFRVTLNPGERIVLAIGDHTAGDLDLYILSTSGDELSASKDTGTSESLPAPAESGPYIVVVRAAEGASNYILTIGADLGTAAPGHAQGALSTEHDFMPGQTIVRFADAPQIAARALPERAADLGMQMAAGGPGRPVLLTFDEGYQRNDVFRALAIDPKKRIGRAADTELQRKLDTLSVIKALRKRADVLSADPNYILRHYATPNDTHYNLQWHYPLINLPQAWDFTKGSSDVVVAVVDTGVLLGHPDLAGQLTGGYDFIASTSISNDGDGIDDNPDDPGDGATPGASSFHGTHCAGTIAAASDNSMGLAGVSWNAQIMPIRVLGVGGGTLYDIMQGVRYAAGLSNDSGDVPAQRADIISMSLGGGPYTQPAQDLFDEVRGAGVILIAAAGNQNVATPSYPASYEGVISVSAVNINSTKASYSNFGQYIDVAAPGGDSGDLDGDGYADKVWSTCGSDSSGTIQFNYAAYNGTSMATPHVAGVVALMKSVRPGLTPNELDAYLRTGLITNDIGTTGRDDLYGYGLIDAHKAVIVAQDNPDITVLTVAPAVLNFGANATTATLTASKIGSGDLSITSVTQSPNAPWLSVAANPGDASGLGTYTVTVNRDGLTNGTYTASITFTSSNTVVVPVNLQVHTTSGSADAGFHYVLLLDSTTYGSVQQYDVAAVDGSYNYTFTGIPAGNYLIVAGSDRDNDNFIDNAGESLGAYSSLDSITTVTVGGNRDDLDFTTDLRLFLPTSAAAPLDAGAGAAPVFKRLR